MISSHYQQELANLRELAVEFSQTHPALAPMLSGPTQDPDVERLLEGTAFLTGLLRQKLEDEFPEVVHGLMRLIFPHYLRPIPSATVISFTPKPSLMESLTIPANVALASIPVDGTKCLFKTCYPVEVHPLKLTEARIAETPGRTATLSLRFELTGPKLNDWRINRLRLHFSGPFAEAANLYHLFFHRIRQIRVTPITGGQPLILGPECLKPVGLGREESLFPYPPQSFPGYGIIQEYLILPEKYLFLDITNLATWTDRGTGQAFQIHFDLSGLPAQALQIKKENFVLYATPAVNLFPFDADPITQDHRSPEYRIIPSGGNQDHYQVYSVDSVTGFAPGTVQKREFAPFELFTPQAAQTPTYYVGQRNSPVRNRPETFISVAYPPTAEPPTPETLSIKLWCTNSTLAENLKLGDICKPTSSSPELCEFRNILPPTSAIQPPLGRNVLWRFLSHLSLNLLSLAQTENLKALLRLYIFPEGRDRSAILANEKRIGGIVDFRLRAVDRLVRGQVLRGQELHLKLNPDNFASRGDMFLFGVVMDFFLGTYAGINSFTHLTVEDSLKGETFSWPVRLGDRPLT